MSISMPSSDPWNSECLTLVGSKSSRDGFDHALRYNALYINPG